MGSREAYDIVWAVSARARRQPAVRGALEVSSFAFMRANQQRCDRDWTIFVMVDPNFQATSVRWCAMAWYAQSCCGRLRGAAKGDVEPTEAAKSPASTQLEHFEVWHGGAFACSKCAMDAASRYKSGREPNFSTLNGAKP